MRSMTLACVSSLGLLLAVGAAGCGSDTPSNNMNNGGNADLATPMMGPVDMAKAPKPDMTNLSMGPVGGECMSAADCGGNKPKCLMSIDGFQYMGQPLMLPAPNGYCSDDACKSDSDCGPGGYCFPGINLCFGMCEKAGDCAAVNPGNICIPVQGAQGTCFPVPQFLSDSCNPTKKDACAAGKGCLRHVLASLDDFGSCVDTCKLGAACPNAANGAAQACYFINTAFDAMGKATKDTFAGLTCLPDASMGGGAPDDVCGAGMGLATQLATCQPGYECNLYAVGGVGKVCRKLCTNGGNECVLGTCQNAFKLANFDMGSVGLCL